MQTFDVQDPDLDIFQSRLLEASAGTGKTYTIEHLVMRFILDESRPIDITRILAITFTNEAASELKTRIRSLLQAKEHQDNPRVRNALAAFDEVPIFTIHGFCHKMLQTFAFEAQTPLGQMGSEKADHLLPMRQCVEDFIRSGPSMYGLDVSVLLKKMRLDLDRFIDQVVDVMQKTESPSSHTLLPPPDYEEEHLKADLLQLAPRYKRLDIDLCQKQMPRFFTLLRNGNIPSFLEESDWFFEKMVEENARVKAAPLESVSLKASTAVAWIQNSLAPSLRKMRDPTFLLQKIGAACRKRWIEKAQRFDHTTFDDLLEKMAKALNNPLFLKKVRERFDVAIIDEFQDTDPTQWKIFDHLFFKTHLIYLVGDPKQSIYGFRKADIYTYLQASRQLGDEKRAHLDTNYRSSPQLITALNELFTQNETWLGVPREGFSIDYHPVKAGREESSFDEAPIHYFGVRGKKGRERSWPTKKMEEELIFPYIGSEILRLNETKNISFSSIAILISDRFEAKRMQLHLDKWNIPSSIKRSFHIAESKGFEVVFYFIKALAEPQNKGAIRLLTSLFPKGAKHHFSHLATQAIEEGLGPTFNAFFQSQDPFDPMLYRQMRQTIEVLLTSEATTPGQYLDEMDRLRKSDPETDPRLRLVKEEGDDAVAIMTTFASKGLEFDVVFPLSIAKQATKEESEDERAEQMRKLYVALTRAKEKLYLPIYSGEEGAVTPLTRLLEGVEPSIEWVDSRPIVPRNTVIVQQELSSPPEAHLKFPEESYTSFTALATPKTHDVLREEFLQQDISKKTPHTLPLGSETGVVIHTILEKTFKYPDTPIENIVFEQLNGTHLEGWEEVIVSMIDQTLNTELQQGLMVHQLLKGKYLQEMEFIYPEGGQLIKGFIDLVFQHGDHFYVLDWKTNWLGPGDEYYTKDALKQAMEVHDYYLQARLYQEALRRFVNPLYSKAKFGGAYYFFVRGNQWVHVDE